MAWSRRFLDALQRPRFARMAWIIEGFDPGSGWQTAAWSVVSEPGLPGDAVLIQSGWQTVGPRVQLRTWQASGGAFTFGVARRTAVLQRMIRGQCVRVRLGFAGWPASAFEVIGVYQLWSIENQGPGAVVVCRDLLTALQSRLTTDYAKTSLFAGLTTTSVTLTAGYTAGSGSATVSGTAAFHRQDDGGGALKGMIKISGAGGDFFRSWTAKTSTVFTVSTSTYNINTADANASSGVGVTEVAFLDDHPLTAVRRLLVSTGTALRQGTYDTLPETWGYGLPLWLVDEADIAEGVAKTQPASGSADWLLWSTDEAPDGIAWIESWLNAGGHFLTMRQGALTARPVYDPAAKMPTFLVDDRDIVACNWAAFDSECPQEFAALNVRRATGTGGTTLSSTSEALGTLPAESGAELDAGTDGWTADNSAIATEVRDRVKNFYLRVPERLTLSLAGWRAAALAVGDLVEITSRRIGGRREGLSGYSRRRGWAAAVSPDWIGGTTRIEVAILPDDGTIFS